MSQVKSQGATGESPPKCQKLHLATPLKSSTTYYYNYYTTVAPTILQLVREAANIYKQGKVLMISGKQRMGHAHGKQVGARPPV
jgi:hypothetical protein